jgi:hypothetical protein
MFREIDINGDQSMEWDVRFVFRFSLALVIDLSCIQEFVSFIVESGMVFSDNSKVDAVERVRVFPGCCVFHPAYVVHFAILQYSPSDLQDNIRHEHGVERIFYFPGWDKVVVAERSPVVRILDPAVCFPTFRVVFAHHYLISACASVLDIRCDQSDRSAAQRGTGTGYRTSWCNLGRWYDAVLSFRFSFIAQWPDRGMQSMWRIISCW